MAQVNVISRFNYSDKLVGIKGSVYKLENIRSCIRSAVIGDLMNTVSEKYKVKTYGVSSYHNFNYYTPFYEPGILLKTFSVSTNKIYKGGKGKYIFRNILYKNIPKKYYCNYKKNGFGVPLVDWMQRMILPEIKKITTEKKIKKQNLFYYNAIMDLIYQFDENPDYNKAVVLWCYYIFQLWYVENIENV